jgi:hypothetical protein
VISLTDNHNENVCNDNLAISSQVMLTTEFEDSNKWSGLC